LPTDDSWTSFHDIDRYPHVSNAQGDDLAQQLQIDVSNTQMSSDSDMPALFAPCPSLVSDSTLIQRYTASSTAEIDESVALQSDRVNVPVDEADRLPRMEDVVPYYHFHADTDSTVHHHAYGSGPQSEHASGSSEHDHLYDDDTAAHASTDTAMVPAPIPNGIDWQVTLGAIRGHDKLEWIHVNLPLQRDLSEHQVLVRMSAVSLCAADVKLRQHQQHQATWSSHASACAVGFNGSGVVVAVGSTQRSSSSTSSAARPVTAVPFRVGDPVYGRIKYALAQYAVADVSSIVRCYPHQSICEAAACGAVVESSGYVTPTIAFNHESLDTSLRDKTIYLNTGGGAVGHLLLQALKAMNNRVISAYSRFDTFMLLHELRCDLSINYVERDVVYEIMRYTNGKGCDVVIDLLATPQTMEQAALCVADRGTMYAIHLAADTPATHQQHRHRHGHSMQSKLQRKYVTVRQISLGGTQYGFTISPTMLTPCHSTNNEAVVKPHIHRRCEFSRHGVNQALSDIESRRSTGSIIVNVA